MWERFQSPQKHVSTNAVALPSIVSSPTLPHSTQSGKQLPNCSRGEPVVTVGEDALVLSAVPSPLRTWGSCASLSRIGSH